MKIKRFFAPDMRQAIRMVRDEQGPDAVILSNRKVNGGVEIISAVDYDEALVQQAATEAEPATASQPAAAPVANEQPAAPAEPPALAQHQAATAAAQFQANAQPETAAPRHDQVEWSQDPALVAMRQEISQLRGLLEHELAHLTWGDLNRNNPARVELLKRMNAMGTKPRFAQQLVERVAHLPDLEQAWKAALGLFAETMPVTDKVILDEGGMVAVVGSTGVGKTTTVAKLAARYSLRHGNRRVALVTTDSYRIGAHEQLLTYGKILGVPVHVASDHQELERVLRSLMDKHLVLIDTAGMSQRDMRLSEQFATLHQVGMPIKTYLVISATAQGAVQEETIKAFRGVALNGCILTKVDETASLGGTLSVISEQQLPMAYVCDGQRVPEDLQPARPDDLMHQATQLMTSDEWSPGDTVMAERFGGAVAHAHG